ncbi:MAG: aminodeoxychorismate/anthranilate synthase component II [Lachnospiraceae bacterium]|nr:aminodeoxychorismate/anthranilate synthase component II [Lachnospiraceae bacterium]
MILLIDNYDSFSYNLYQYLGEITQDIKVIRNDECTVEEIRAMSPERIVISPGPGRPEDAGICVELIREIGKDIPILGVCLGHQAICVAYGATVTYAKKLMHGKQSRVRFDTTCPIFRGCSDYSNVARYHSLAVDESTLPEQLRSVAATDDKEVMAVMHTGFPVYGVQFHPESIMTDEGMKMLENFCSGV